MTTFAYRCLVDNKDISEATHRVAALRMHRSARESRPGPQLQVFCPSCRVLFLDVPRGQQTDHVVRRRASRAPRERSTATTRVHRRFRDFVEFDETLRASLTGYATKSSLPKPPNESLTFLKDHSDEAFLRERLRELDTAVKKLVEVPHAWLSTGAPAFVGLSDAVP